MTKYPKSFLVLAHDMSIYHEKRIRESSLCGCFYCKITFKPEQILDWTDEKAEKENTACCPFCGIDSVLGDDFPIWDSDFLSQMHVMWFIA